MRSASQLALAALLSASASGCGLFTPTTEPATCSGDADCPTGYHCQTRQCVAVDAATIDGALADAGNGDTARRDASGRDVEHDAANDGGSDATDAQFDSSADAAVEDVPLCSFDAGSLDVPFSFDPAMTKRWTNAIDGGPFHVAPLIQASDEGACSRGDAIVVDKGLRIGGTFFDRFDSAQGTIVFWVTPEWNIVDISDAARHFLRIGDFGFGVDGQSHGAFVQLGSERVIFSGAFTGWTAGTTHFVALRWDVRTRSLDRNYVHLRVDRTGYGALQNAVAAPATNTQLIIGAFDETGLGAIGAFIEGLTIYRRPLTDPNGGVDVGQPNEINNLFNIGRGIEPTLLTGSWDVVFALPTDAEDTVLAMPRDASQAFGHPFHDNRLGEPGYLITSSQLASWSTVGSNVLVEAATEKIFGGGAKVTTITRNSGIAMDFTSLSAGHALVVRALVHSDGTSVVRLRLSDASVELFHVDGTRSSRRDRPDVLIGTATVATGTALHLELLNNAAANSSFHVHQVEVLRNLLRNPSFEEGATSSSGEWLPDAWANSSPNALRTRQEIAIVHSGTTSVGLDNAGTQNYASIVTANEVAGFDSWGDFYTVGGYFDRLIGVPPSIFPDNGCLMALYGPIVDWRNKFEVAASPGTGTWQHVAGVGRRFPARSDDAVNCQYDLLHYGGRWGANIDVLVDDVYVVKLDRVPITVAPADLARSLTRDALLVNGMDALVQPISNLTANSGSISVRLALAQPVVADSLFCPNGVLYSIYGDPSNHITVEYYGSGRVLVWAEFGGVRWNGWTVPSAVIDEARLHTFVIEYSDTGMIGLSVDSSEKFWTSRGDVTPFSVTPTTVFYGLSPFSGEHCDLRVGREGAVVSGQ